ncbi:MAG: hypothetical protein HY376_02575 [Candidatus Blackburnbacteria bacterium]|nr:hypothetical protein [Candidatus Blackburnbacteria bacterium]
MGINLVGQVSKQEAQNKRLVSVLKRTSFIVLAVYFVVLAIVFGVRFLFAREEASLVLQGKTVTNQIKALNTSETLLNTVKNRTAIAGRIIDTSPQAPEKLFVEVTSVLPAGAKIMQVEASSDSFNVTIETPDSKTLSQVFSAITASQFTSIELSSLSLTNAGFYDASLNIR